MAANPLKRFWSCYSRNYKTKLIIPLWTSYYIPKNPQNTINQTALKHYNQFISIGTEDLRCLKITTDTVNKPKVEPTVK